MSVSLYSNRSNLILGFHGTTKDRADNIFAGRSGFYASINDYDWLGNGMYFWENNLERAKQWAADKARRKGDGIEPAVIGAVLDLGHCLDLTDSEYLEELAESYKKFKRDMEEEGAVLPVNSSGGSPTDLLLRKLDCALINYHRQLHKESGMGEYDSVRGVFWEGGDLYEGAGFKSKNHIQIAVINPNCIKGFFRPRNINRDYNLI